MQFSEENRELRREVRAKRVVDAQNKKINVALQVKSSELEREVNYHQDTKELASQLQQRITTLNATVSKLEDQNKKLSMAPQEKGNTRCKRCLCVTATATHTHPFAVVCVFIC